MRLRKLSISVVSLNLLIPTVALAQPKPDTVTVVAGTYGGNCAQPRGNKTQFLATACNGKETCDYKIDYTQIGDPAKGCLKDYAAEWRCGNSMEIRRASAASEAGNGSIVMLTCEPDILAVSDEHADFSVDGRVWTPAVATWVHPSWPSVPAATWIWRTKTVTPQEAQRGSDIVTFRRRFDWSGAAGAAAVIQIAVDNAYELTINGTRAGASGDLDPSSTAGELWRTTDRHRFALKAGQNEVMIRAINYHAPGGGTDPQANPAGVLFRVDVARENAATLASAIKASGKVDVYGILFDVDKTAIKPQSTPTLDEMAKLLKDDPSLTLEVAGHTDNTGTRAHNIALSKGRAYAVVQALVKNYGISRNRLRPKGYGDTKPAGPNDTEFNRARNRRVELRKL